MPTEKPASGKVCALCGQECGLEPRQKDAEGRYFHVRCLEKRRKTQAAPDAPPSPQRAGGRESDPLLDLARYEAAATPIEEDAGACPECRATMPLGAAICTGCGFNRRTGVRLSPGSLAAAPEALKRGGGSMAAKAAKTGTAGGSDLDVGRLILGLFLSVIGAGVGVGLWAVVGILTGYEVGLVAWALGGLAGGGMLLGYGRKSIVGGVSAAVVSLGGILFVKAIIAVAIFAVSAVAEDVDTHRAVLAMEKVGKWVEANPDASPAAMERYTNEAIAEMNAMPEDEVRLRMAESMGVSAEEFDQAREEVGTWSAFSAWDALWILLALTTAYGVAAHQK